MADQPTGAYQIGVTCPGCGAELLLSDDFFLLRCTHCGTNVRITLPDGPVSYLVQGTVTEQHARVALDRHLKSLNQLLTPSQLQFKSLYYPYWQIEAVLLHKITRRISSQTENQYQSSTPREFNETREDFGSTPFYLTVAAGAVLDGIPQSLGYRPSYLKLHPFSKEACQESFDLLPVHVPTSTAMQRATAALATRRLLDQLSDEERKTSQLLQPRFSLLYFPYLIVEWYQGEETFRYVVDGITADIFADSASNEVSESFVEASTNVFNDAPRTLLVEVHRCDECGYDLPTAHSYLYVCENCQHVAVIDGDSIAIEKAQSPESTEAYKSTLLFPFWSISVAEEAIPAMNRLFGSLHPIEQIYVPAFGENRIEQYTKLARRMTNAGAHFSRETFSPSESDTVMPVTVTAVEAYRAAELLLARVVLERGGKMPARIISSTNGKTISLLLLPCREEQYQFVDSLVGAITFEKRLGNIAPTTSAR